MEFAINKKRSKMIYSLFHKNKKYLLNVNNAKYNSKDKDIVRLKDDILNNNDRTSKEDLNEKELKGNNYTKNRLIYNHNKWNDYYNNVNITSSRPKFRVGYASSTSTNFWKDIKNSKYKLNNLIRKKSNKKSAKMRIYNYNLNRIKNNLFIKYKKNV